MAQPRPRLRQAGRDTSPLIMRSGSNWFWAQNACTLVASKQARDGGGHHCPSPQETAQGTLSPLAGSWPHLPVLRLDYTRRGSWHCPALGLFVSLGVAQCSVRQRGSSEGRTPRSQDMQLATGAMNAPPALARALSVRPRPCKVSSPSETGPQPAPATCCADPGQQSPCHRAQGEGRRAREEPGVQGWPGADTRARHPRRGRRAGLPDQENHEPAGAPACRWGWVDVTAHTETGRGFRSPLSPSDRLAHAPGYPSAAQGGRCEPRLPLERLCLRVCRGHWGSGAAWYGRLPPAAGGAPCPPAGARAARPGAAQVCGGGGGGGGRRGHIWRFRPARSARRREARGRPESRGRT